MRLCELQVSVDKDTHKTADHQITPWPGQNIHSWICASWNVANVNHISEYAVGSRREKDKRNRTAQDPICTPRTSSPPALLTARPRRQPSPTILALQPSASPPPYVSPRLTLTILAARMELNALDSHRRAAHESKLSVCSSVPTRCRRTIAARRTNCDETLQRWSFLCGRQLGSPRPAPNHALPTNMLCEQPQSSIGHR